MADRTITFTLCPKLDASEGDKVFFKVKDPSILSENSELEIPLFYLIEATITSDIIINCHQHQYTFTYNGDVLVEGAELLKTSIDKIGIQDCNTQYIKEMFARSETA